MRYSRSMELSTTLSPGFLQRYCPDICATFDLPELYAEFNAKFFRGDLPLLNTTEITDENGEDRVLTQDIVWDGRYRTVYGKYVYGGKGRGKGQIRLAKFMAYDHIQVKSTLLHEMVHKYLDYMNQDDGIKGHGPNFIDQARRINAQCEEWNLPYRVNFFDLEVTKEQPEVYSDMLMTTVYCGRDLDVARRMQAVIRAAFHEGCYDYQQ